MKELTGVKDIYIQESLVSAMLFVWKTPENAMGNIAKEGLDKNVRKGRENEN